jgi:hypothetical protein
MQNVGKTATNDLTELTYKYKLVHNVGFGAGSFYELTIGQIGQIGQ